MGLYLPDGENIMTTGLQTVRRSLVALIVAALLAVTAAYGPVALELAGVEAGTPVYACQSQGGGGC